MDGFVNKSPARRMPPGGVLQESVWLFEEILPGLSVDPGSFVHKIVVIFCLGGIPGQNARNSIQGLAVGEGAGHMDHIGGIPASDIHSVQRSVVAEHIGHAVETGCVEMGKIQRLHRGEGEHEAHIRNTGQSSKKGG